MYFFISIFYEKIWNILSSLIVLFCNSLDTDSEGDFCKYHFSPLSSLSHEHVFDLDSLHAHSLWCLLV